MCMRERESMSSDVIYNTEVLHPCQWKLWRDYVVKVKRTMEPVSALPKMSQLI